MATSSDSSENWLVTMDRMFLDSDDSGIGRHLGGPFPDTGDDHDHTDRGPLEIKLCRLKESLRPASPGKCARIADEKAKCFVCQQEVPKGEYVILYQCGHWVQRLCFHLWKDGGMVLKCPYHCPKKQQNFRSLELMSEEHDINEDELTDIEELLEADRQLTRLGSNPQPPPKPSVTTSRVPSPSISQIDNESVYDGDIEDANERHEARMRRRRRRIIDRGLLQVPSATPLPQAGPDVGFGSFFPPEDENQEDFGERSGLTLSQLMFNLPRSREAL